MAEIDSLELLLQVKAVGLENLKAVSEATKVLGTNATATNSVLESITKQMQGTAGAIKSYTADVAMAMSDMVKQISSTGARAAEDAEKREVNAIERTIKALERKASLVGKSGAARAQQQTANLLGGFDGKATEEQINRVGAAFAKLSQLTESSGRTFASSIRQFIQNPLYAIGTAAESVLTAMGPFGIALGAVGLLAGAAALGVFKLASSFAQTEIEIKNFAARIGTSTTFAQEFIGATARMGVNGEALTASIRKLAGGLAEGGEAGKLASEGIEKLGIHARTVTGDLRPMEQLIPEIFKALGAVPDFAERNVLALNILGRSFKELAPAMKEYEENAAKVRQSGVIIDPKTLDDTDKFRKQLNDLTNQWTGLVHSLQTKAVGVIEISGVMNLLSNVAKGANAPGGGALGYAGAFLGDVIAPGLGSAAHNFFQTQSLLDARHPKPTPNPIEGNTEVPEGPAQARLRASNSARAAALIGQYDKQAAVKQAEDKVNDIVKQLDSIKTGGGAPTSGPGSLDSLQRQLAIAQSILETAKALNKYEGMEKSMRDLVNESVAKELFGVEKINAEYEKRVGDIDKHLPSSKQATLRFAAGEIRDNDIDRYNASRSTERATQSRAEQLAIGGGASDLDRLSGQRQSLLDIAGGRLVPDSPAGIIKANTDRQSAITRQFQDSLKPINELSGTIAGTKDPAEQDRIRHEVQMGFIAAEKKANEERYASETQMESELANLQKKTHDESLAAAKQIADLQISGQKSEITRQSQLAGPLSDVANGGPKGNPVAAARDALQARLVLADQLTAKEMERIALSETGAQRDVATAKALLDLSNERGEAEIKYQETIAELQKKRLEEYQSQAKEIAGALLTRGGTVPFLKSGVKGLGEQVLGNALTPIVKSVSETISTTIGGSQRDASGNPTGFGKLLQGTFLAPHDEQNVTLTANTSSTDRNTAATIALTNSMAEIKAMTTPAAANAGPSAGVAALSTLPPGQAAITSAIQLAGIPGISPELTQAIAYAGTGIEPPSDLSGLSVGNPDITGSTLAPSPIMSSLSTLSKGISGGIGGLASFGALMANPFGDKGGTPGVDGQPGTDNGHVSALGVGAAAADVAVGAISAIHQFSQGTVRGDINGVGSVLGTAAALDPEPISKAILGASAMVTGIVSSLLGDPKQQRQIQLNNELQAAQYTAPVPVNLQIDSSGHAIDQNYKGQTRVLNALPTVSTIQQAIGFEQPTNETGIGALLGLQSKPGGVITTGQRRLGQTDLPTQTITVVNNISAMDSKSFMDNAGNIADALKGALQNGHPVAGTIANRIRPV